MVDRIGERIKSTRKALGLSPDEAAAQLGITLSEFEDWESAARPPVRKELGALVRVLGTGLLPSDLTCQERLEVAQIVSGLHRADIAAILGVTDWQLMLWKQRKWTKAPSGFQERIHGWVEATLRGVSPPLSP